jgi:hypothetical protein
MSKHKNHEGLGMARLLMVMSSFSPLFILLGIRGVTLIPDTALLIFCGLMVLMPNFFLYWRIRTARTNRELRELVIGRAEDHRDHLLVYLFAVLLPFYTVELKYWRDLTALVAALSFVIFLFWHLNLHYLNLVFAIFGFRVFTVYPTLSDNQFSGRESYVLITRRATLLPGVRVSAYRVSETVYLEGED